MFLFEYVKNQKFKFKLYKLHWKIIIARLVQIIKNKIPKYSSYVSQKKCQPARPG